MDEFDRRATESMAKDTYWWVQDTIYPGSRVLTADGIGLRDMLAAAYRRDAQRHEDLIQENARLRSALEPFARLALTRSARNADDFHPVTSIMAHCRAAQKAMVATNESDMSFPPHTNIKQDA